MVAFMDIEGAFNNVDPMAIVSLLLWNVVVNRLLMNLNSLLIKTVAYADDVAIASIGRAAKAISAIYVCKRAIGRTWGLRPDGVLWLYEMVVKPILFYGVTVWWQALDPVSNRLLFEDRSHSSGTDYWRDEDNAD
ncbi:hypothetical protein EVAR_74050_1 [Eumeta japonica]|uniref:Reverse transcriptase domain-containing protein n=1 Tax=Eumeta variegata TaxID=151549 RepID=A0A4C1TGJ4_EUMVA|nr:hypothetical protein EVAR_74050_1 [Eumeta japonica]